MRIGSILFRIASYNKNLSLLLYNKQDIMEPENRLNYIIPQFVKYQNVDDLLENNSHYSLFGTEHLSIDKLLEESFVCIVGEPGIGKSRLLDEVKERISSKPFFL